MIGDYRVMVSYIPYFDTTIWSLVISFDMAYGELFNFNKIPTRCNSMRIFIYCKVTLHVSCVTAPIIRSTKNCNRSLRYWSYCKIQANTHYQFIPVNPCILQYDLYRRLRLQFLVLLMMGAVTPETCRVTLQ